MVVALTGSKYTGTLTSVGTTTLTDSSASFVSGDFAYNVPRMIWLFRSGVPVALARCIEAASGTVLTLDAPFVDYDGDEVAQVSGDTYYVSQDHNDVATTGWAVSGNVVTITDRVEYGVAGDHDSLFLHMEDVVLEVVGVSASNPDNAVFIGLGGCVSYGNPIDIKGRQVGNRCIYNPSGVTANGTFSCKDLAFTQMHFGTKFIEAVNNPGGTGASNFTPGFWQVFMNCEMVNSNFTSPSGGGPWTSRAEFQRVINPVSVAGQTNALNLRWSNGYIEGGAFSTPGGGLAPFGADANGTYVIGGATGERLSVYAAAKNSLFRCNVANTVVVNFKNLLTQDAFKNAITSLGPNFNTNATLNFSFEEKYTGLDEGAKIVIKDAGGSVVFSETVAASGETSPIDLLYQVRTHPTTSTASDVFSNPWQLGIYKYGKQPITATLNVFDDTLAGRTVKNISFGGPLVQADDLSTTEASQATALGYTTTETNARAYDHLNAILERDYDGEGATFATIGGAFGSRDVILTTGTGEAVVAPTSITLNTGGTFTGSLSSTGDIICNSAMTLAGGSYSKVVLPSGFSGTLTLDGATVTEIENTSGNAVTVSLLNGGAVSTLTATSGSLTAVENVAVTAANLVSGSRVQLWNVTKGAELDNSTVSGGGGYSFTANLQSADVDAGDTLRIRATQVSGANALAEFEETAVITTTGLAFIGAQVADDVYDTLNINGGGITKFTADYGNDEVDLSIASNFTAAEFYAWWVANLTTANGIRNFFGGVTAIDSANFRINNSIVGILFDNTTTTNLHQTDNRRIFRADLARPVKDPTTGGGGIDIEWRAPVSLANTDAITASLAAILEDTGTTLPAQIDGIGGGSAPTEAEMYTYFTSESRENAFKADVSALASQASVDALPTLAEMEASAPLTAVADVSGVLTAISALNDFDPATDVVARVTLVDTVTTNTDMRGTDGANTIAPDNASIAAILADTNELQQNQGNWLTATGFATSAQAATILADIGSLSTSVAAIPTTTLDAEDVWTYTVRTINGPLFT